VILEQQVPNGGQKILQCMTQNYSHYMSLICELHSKFARKRALCPEIAEIVDLHGKYEELLNKTASFDSAA